MQRSKMNSSMLSIVLESGLDLRKVCTTGSVLHINEDFDDVYAPEAERDESKTSDYIGKPVSSLKLLENQLTSVDPDGYVKKKVFERGGGEPLHEGCTVHISYTGFWEANEEPFDVRKLHKPMIVDLNDNDLLPGMKIAVNSMLVGEVSIFLLSYKVMFGELGIPPRIKPKADCVFYIKLVKSILTPEEGDINYSEPNMFQRVYSEVTKLYSSGVTLHKCQNSVAAVQLFRKSIFMLHKCRLADEKEEQKQEKMLIKLYLNQAICYNRLEQPLKACVACNELRRLNNLWNNSKALFQNAKALRMIGQFDEAEKKLLGARKVSPLSSNWKLKKEIEEEYNLLKRMRDSCDQSRLIAKNMNINLISDEFKNEVDTLIKNFKENVSLCKLILPSGLNTMENKYIKEACIRENLYYSRFQKDYALDKTDDENKSEEDSEENLQQE